MTRWWKRNCAGSAGKSPSAPGRQGLRGFLEQYLNSLLTDGTAVAEMIPAADGSGLGAVLLCPAESLAVRRAENGVGLRFYAARDGLPGEEVRWPELILYTPLDPDAGEVWGHSVLEGLEAVEPGLGTDPALHRPEL